MSDQTATKNAPRKNPPKPRFALSVGVVGHRPDDLARGVDPEREARLKKIVNDVEAALTAIKTAAAQSRQDYAVYFDGEHAAPVLTLVSALAPGADTIAADAALALGYQLVAPLPFAREEYRHDFKTLEAKAHYNQLLKQARCLELPGHKFTRGESDDDKMELNRAYEAAGLTVLSQADIVLAVWDGELSRGRGGTAEMVSEAVRAGIPILLIDAHGILPLELRWRSLIPTPIPVVSLDDLPSAKLDTIYRVMDELVRPPNEPEQRESLGRWFLESSHRGNVQFGYALLTSLLFAYRLRYFHIFPRRVSELADEYVRNATPVVDPTAPEQIAWMSEPYGWADAVAIYFAQFFRGAVVMNSGFAALSVIAASATVMTLHADKVWTHLAVAIEILLIFCVAANTMLGRHLRWDRRWLGAREIAERLRVALPLWTLGLRPAFLSGEEPTWTGWYTRALVRMQGMRLGNLNASRLTNERKVLLHLLTDQCDYNNANARRMRGTARGLEFFGFCFLSLTMVVAVNHFFDGPLVDDTIGRVFPPDEATIWLSAALPTLATASYLIRVIVDFEGIAHRSERIYRELDQIIAAIKQDPPDLAIMRDRARSAAGVILRDIITWREVAEQRSLEIPG